MAQKRAFIRGAYAVNSFFTYKNKVLQGDDKKTIDLFTDSYSDSGAVNVDGSTLHCWKHGGHGQQTFLQVVQNP